jgi:hypothetical protein
MFISFTTVFTYIIIINCIERERERECFGDMQLRSRVYSFQLFLLEIAVQLFYLKFIQDIFSEMVVHIRCL